MLILDLDDTIFETRSMPSWLFQKAIEIIENHYFDEKLKAAISNDLWKWPAEVVFKNYKTPENVVSHFYKKLTEVDFKQLKINTYPDYTYLHEFNLEKILVTTGVAELQNAKIKALGIESDFSRIFIDDPRRKPRQTKFDIFKNILLENDVNPENVYIIGDNPQSEIKAGNALNAKTILRVSNKVPIAFEADFIINSFEELKGIIR